MSDRRFSRETNGTPTVRRSGICKCGVPARAGQGDCHECHAGAQLRYTSRLKAKRQANDAAYIRLINERAKHASDHTAHIRVIAGRNGDSA